MKVNCAFFPFLIRDKEPTRTNELKYKYAYAYKELQINPISIRRGEYNCMFWGNEDDSFHFAVYN